MSKTNLFKIGLKDIYQKVASIGVEQESCSIKLAANQQFGKIVLIGKTIPSIPYGILNNYRILCKYSLPTFP